MQEVSTTDLYESAFYLIKGCELTAVEGIQLDGKVTCQMVFSSPNMGRLQAEYFNGNAEVRLFDFRRSYGQINKLVNDSRRKFQRQLKEGGEG